MKARLLLSLSTLIFSCVAGAEVMLFDIADQSHVVTWDTAAPDSAYPRRVEDLETDDLFFDKFAPVLEDGSYLLSVYPTIGKGYIERVPKNWTEV